MNAAMVLLPLILTFPSADSIDQLLERANGNRDLQSLKAIAMELMKVNPAEVGARTDEVAELLGVVVGAELLDGDEPERASAFLAKLGPNAIRPLLRRLDPKYSRLERAQLRLANVLRDAIREIAPSDRDELWPTAEPIGKAWMKVDDQPPFGLGDLLAGLSPESMPLLLESLDADPVRPGLAEGLGKLGEAAVDPVLERFGSKDTDRREMAARIFMRMGPPAAKAVPDLARRLKALGGEPDANSSEAKGVLLALHAIGPAALAASDEIIPWIRRSSTTAADIAALALGTVGVRTESVETLLEAVAEAEELDDDTIRRLGGAFARLDDRGLKTLAEGLNQRSSQVRRLAIQGLRQRGVAARQHEEALRFSLRNDSTRTLAAVALHAMGADLRAEIPEFLRDLDRIQVEQSKITGGWELTTTVPILEFVIPGRDPEYRGPYTLSPLMLFPEGVKTLNEAIRNGPRVRRLAACALIAQDRTLFANAKADILRVRDTSKDPAELDFAAATLAYRDRPAFDAWLGKRLPASPAIKRIGILVYAPKGSLRAHTERLSERLLEPDSDR